MVLTQVKCAQCGILFTVYEQSPSIYCSYRCRMKPVKPVKPCKRGSGQRREKGRTWRRTPTCTSWQQMTRRCMNPDDDRYSSYGGAGVIVCLEWRTLTGFITAMGERPAGTTLGRILDLGNYEPGNAFWMTQQEQNLAKRNHNALLKFTNTHA